MKLKDFTDYFPSFTIIDLNNPNMKDINPQDCVSEDCYTTLKGTAIEVSNSGFTMIGEK